MTREYLQRYNFTEERFLIWIKGQGFNPQDAVNLLITYSKTGKDFRSGDELCTELVKNLNKMEMDRFVYTILEQEQKVEPVIPAPEKSRLRKIWDLIVGR